MLHSLVYLIWSFNYYSLCWAWLDVVNLDFILFNMSHSSPHRTLIMLASDWSVSLDTCLWLVEAQVLISSSYIEVCVFMAALLGSIVASDHLNKMLHCCSIYTFVGLFLFFSRELMWHDVVLFYLFLAAKGAAQDCKICMWCVFSSFVKYTYL